MAQVTTGMAPTDKFTHEQRAQHRRSIAGLESWHINRHSWEPQVSRTTRSLVSCVMPSVGRKGSAATFNSFNDTGHSTPISRDRRRVLSGIAASCAGLASAAIAASNPLHPSSAAAQAALHEQQEPCGRSKVVASDEATVVETNAGKLLCSLTRIRTCSSTATAGHDSCAIPAMDGVSSFEAFLGL